MDDGIGVQTAIHVSQKVFHGERRFVGEQLNVDGSHDSVVLDVGRVIASDST
jgi:hypothetical protein